MKIKALALVLMPSALLALSTQDKAYVDKYSVDANVQAILDKHADVIAKKLSLVKAQGKTKHAVWQFSWLPGYYVKYNLDRIKGMEKMNRAIKKHNLDLLMVPDKRIYHVKGRPDRLNNQNYVVVIKAVEEAKHPKPLNLKQVQQLSTLIKETAYVSLTSTNYIRMDNDKIALIDTESTFDPAKISKGLFRFIQGGNIDVEYTDEAVEFIIADLIEYIGSRSRIHISNSRMVHKNTAVNMIQEYVRRRNKKKSS